jgi:hypothetical protein
MLSATVRSTRGKHIHCALWVNDVMYERLFGTKYSTGSLNTVLQLKKGDRVYIAYYITDTSTVCLVNVMFSRFNLLHSLILIQVKNQAHYY